MISNIHEAKYDGLGSFIDPLYVLKLRFSRYYIIFRAAYNTISKDMRDDLTSFRGLRDPFPDPRTRRRNIFSRVAQTAIHRTEGVFDPPPPCVVVLGNVDFSFRNRQIHILKYRLGLRRVGVRRKGGKGDVSRMTSGKKLHWQSF